MSVAVESRVGIRRQQSGEQRRGLMRARGNDHPVGTPGPALLAHDVECRAITVNRRDRRAAFNLDAVQHPLQRGGPSGHRLEYSAFAAIAAQHEEERERCLLAAQRIEAVERRFDEHVGSLDADVLRDEAAGVHRIVRRRDVRGAGIQRARMRRKNGEDVAGQAHLVHGADPAEREQAAERSELQRVVHACANVGITAPRRPQHGVAISAKQVQGARAHRGEELRAGINRHAAEVVAARTAAQRWRTLEQRDGRAVRAQSRRGGNAGESTADDDEMSVIGHWHARVEAEAHCMRWTRCGCSA